MKGIELPINILIIVVVAVIVLIAVIAMFYPAFNSGSGILTLEAAKTQACQSIVEGLKCDTGIGLNTIIIYDFDADKDNTKGTTDAGTNTGASCPTVGPPASNDNLYMLCQCYYQLSGASLPSDCRKLCGC